MPPMRSPAADRTSPEPVAIRWTSSLRILMALLPPTTLSEYLQRKLRPTVGCSHPLRLLGRGVGSLAVRSDSRHLGVRQRVLVGAHQVGVRLGLLDPGRVRGVGAVSEIADRVGRLFGCWVA